jgi:hypothetical protein
MRSAEYNRHAVEQRRTRLASRWMSALAAGSLVAGAGLASAGADSVHAGSDAGPAPANVIDRTLACTTGVKSGVRTLGVAANSGLRKSGRFEWLAGVVVSTPGKPVESRAYYSPNLAVVIAGWPPRPAVTSGSLGMNTVLCTPSRARVPLASRDLAGGAAGVRLPLGALECPAPKRVLVRVRAAFFEPTTLSPNDNGTFLQAIARMRKGQVAVRTPSGKPLVYGEVYDSGKARIFTARTCA